MDFDELLNGLRGVDADTLGDVPGYVDQIAQYVGDLDTNSRAALQEVNTALEEKNAEIQRLQAENYKLMVAKGTNVESEPSPDEDEGDDYGDDDFDPNSEMKEG